MAPPSNPVDEATVMGIVTGAINSLAPVARSNRYSDLDGRPDHDEQLAELRTVVEQLARRVDALT